MTKKRSIGIGLGVGLALVAAIWLAISPYVTLKSMQRAVMAGNGEALNGYIDYDSLRASLKAQATAAIARNAQRLGRPASDVAPAAASVGKMIDTFVQPATITLMLSDTRSPNNPIGGKISGSDIQVRRTGLTRFTVSGGRPGAAVFEMRGLGWKLVGIDPGTSGN